MYKVIAEFEDEKFFIKEIEDYEEAKDFNERTFNYLSVSWGFVDAIGVRIYDDSFSFYENSDYGQTNGFLSVYLVCKGAKN